MWVLVLLSYNHIPAGLLVAEFETLWNLTVHSSLFNLTAYATVILTVNESMASVQDIPESHFREV